MDTSQADLIKTARQRLHWSQRDLAQQLGVSPGYIALLEQAVRSPSTDLWHRITDLIRADPRSQDLFHQDDNDHAEPMEHATLGAAPAFAPEFPVAIPLDPSWFAHIPFTVVAGPAGTGKTTFLRSCGEALETKGVRRVFWASLNAFQNDLGQLHAELLRFFAEEAEPSSGTVEMSFTVSADQPMQVARMVASHIEDHPRVHTILCFDDWRPHGGNTHDFVQYLAANLKKTPVIAATNSQHPAVPGAVIVFVPQPRDEHWSRWCEQWHVPDQFVTRLLERIHRNPLAAVYLRGAVFFAASPDPHHKAEAHWEQVIRQLPAQPDVPWEAILRICVDFLGKEAVQMISEVANAPTPIPLAWFDEEPATGIMPRLTEYKFLATISDSAEPLVSVHEVLHHFVQQLGSAEFPQVRETRTPALSNVRIEMLLKLGRYEEAARSMEQLAQEWFRRAEAPSLFIGWMERLPQDIKQNHRMLELVLARALSLRAHTGDTDHARVILQNLLTQNNLSDGQRLQAIRYAADIAIRQHNYGEAVEWLKQAQRLVRSAPGVFDETPLQTLATRISWEQGQFQEALAALAGSVLHSGADGARLASWEGRSYASLGNFAAAVKAVQRGLEISRREHIRRAEAYNAVLLAEYELVRGNFSRSRRLADRALELAKIIGQPNLETQALMVEAELAVTDLRVAEAQKSLSLAQDALTQRTDDSWSHCYLLVSQARVAQMQPDWIRLYSLARLLEAEAKVMGSIVPRHPVVQAMRVEAAWCWATANYMHEARRVLATVERGQCEWRTGWDAQRLELVAGRHSAAVFEQMARQLIRNAQEAGCPYLAATCGYTAASYGWQRGFSQLASYYAHWTSQLAKSRGWTTLALMAQGIAPAEAESESAAPGQVITHDDGTRSVVAPPRGQQRAREDTGLPIVDPYEE